MNQGEVLMTGTPDAVRADRRVQEIYTGTGIPEVEHSRSDAARGGRGTDPALRARQHLLRQEPHPARRDARRARRRDRRAARPQRRRQVDAAEDAGRAWCRWRRARSNMKAAISPACPPRISRALGIGYVPQGRGLFAGMTVRENLSLGRLARKTDGSHGVVWSEEQILEYFPRLKERMDVAADYLSGGEQQMVAVARAMSGNVKLLLLDEPFEGLAPAVILELFKVFDLLRRHTSIVIVEHNLDLVLALADRVFALERGAVFHQGPAAPLLTDLEYRKKILWL